MAEKEYESYFAYLNELRDSGETNMFGAVPYLQASFPELRYDRRRAADVLTAWMHSFREEEEMP